MNLKERIIAWHGGDEDGAQSAFAVHIDVSRMTVSRWFKGVEPRGNLLERANAGLLKPMQRTISVPVATASRPPVEFTLKAQESVSRPTPIPVLSSIGPEGVKIRFEATPIDYLPFLGPTDLFSLKVRGRFLEPFATTGDFLIIRKGSAVEGDYAAVFRQGVYFVENLKGQADIVGLVVAVIRKT